MKVELNIGLGNNPFDASSAAMLTSNILSKHSATDIAFRESKGVYTGKDEDNIVMQFDWYGDKKSLTELLEALCVIMTQECIASYVPSWEEGQLSFSPLYEGERYEFDMQYFERWRKVN